MMYGFISSLSMASDAISSIRPRMAFKLYSALTTPRRASAMTFSASASFHLVGFSCHGNSVAASRMTMSFSNGSTRECSRTTSPLRRRTSAASFSTPSRILINRSLSCSDNMVPSLFSLERIMRRFRPHVDSVADLWRRSSWTRFSFPAACRCYATTRHFPGLSRCLLHDALRYLADLLQSVRSFLEPITRAVVGCPQSTTRSVGNVRILIGEVRNVLR